MQVSSILHTKGTAVATVEPSATVADAARSLAVNGVGALVVSSDGTTIDGILSERDVARAVGTEGASALERPVRDLMTPEVTTCQLGDTVDQLMETMTARRVRHLPVVDGGHMVGIISIGDVVKHRLGELKQEAETLHEYLITGR